MENNRISGFECSFPTGLGYRTSVETLKDSKSAVSVAADTRSIVIIPDLASECKKGGSDRVYLKGGAGSINDGSMLCYPITDDTNAVVMAISIKTATKKFFTCSKKDHYIYLLQRFAFRIAMEYQFKIIKEAINA
jgi:hypothetical protein